jgi:molybdate transport system substrate-binding protein
MRTRGLIAALMAGSLLVASGCGSSSSSTPTRSASGGSGSKPDLTVSAAASLRKAFTEYGMQFSAANAKFSFAGSDQLAAQIQQGVKPDVFASANTKLPDALYAKGLVSKPVVFTANRLVIAVPAGATKVRSVADLAKPGVTIATGSASVPVGSYTLKVLSHLPAPERKAILANVRSREPDVAGVIAKVSEKAVDAGFVYVTDVKATSGKATAISLPNGLKPQAAYGIAVVKGTSNPAQAQAFIAGLLSGTGQQDLLKAGFLSPPK